MELRESRQVRDDHDLNAIKSWLESHSPFERETDKRLICLASGIASDSTINCDSALELGLAEYQMTVWQNISDLKLKLKNKLNPMTLLSGSMKVREEVVPVNPKQLFMRILCVLPTSEDFEKYMKYEFTAKPPSLFDGTTMRKTAKSALADVIETKIMRTVVAPTNCVVVDGGFLLHKVVWPKSCTYQVVLSPYVSCVITNYSEGAAVVFDGYEGHLLQRRRNRIAGVSSSNNECSFRSQFGCVHLSE